MKQKICQDLFFFLSICGNILMFYSRELYFFSCVRPSEKKKLRRSMYFSSCVQREIKTPLKENMKAFRPIQNMRQCTSASGGQNEYQETNT